MDDPWEDDDKGKFLPIPGMALPGLRDLRVQFVAVIEFDIFMGPVVHLNEISKGSSYIKKLKNYQTVSEVYAGYARADVDIFTTPEDIIAVFRYEHEEQTDITTILMISCIPETDMEPIRIIGSRALNRARGDPDVIGKELSLSLREFQLSAKMFERAASDVKIKILSEDQILRPLDFSFIKGFCMIDLESNIADFRYFPRYLDGRDLEPPHVLSFLDLQYEYISPNHTTSLLFNGLPLILNRVGTSDIFFLTVVAQVDLLQIQQMGDWLKIAAVDIEREWRYASKNEVISMLSILELSFTLDSPPDFIKNYLHTALVSDKLKPLLVNFKQSDFDSPAYISEQLWQSMDSFQGDQTVLQLCASFKFDYFTFIRFLEWGKQRNIIEYLKS